MSHTNKILPAMCNTCMMKKKAESHLERATAFTALIKRRLSSAQLESFTEEWEAICVDHGWATVKDRNFDVG